MIDFREILKKIFHRGEDIDLNFDDNSLGLDLEKSTNTNVDITGPDFSFGTQQQNQPSSFKQPEFEVSPQMHVPTIPPVPQSSFEFQQIVEHIKVINSKLDILNAKLDQLQQRISLLEQYFAYYRR